MHLVWNFYDHITSGNKKREYNKYIYLYGSSILSIGTQTKKYTLKSEGIIHFNRFCKRIKESQTLIIFL